MTAREEGRGDGGGGMRGRAWCPLLLAASLQLSKSAKPPPSLRRRIQAGVGPGASSSLQIRVWAGAGLGASPSLWIRVPAGPGLGASRVASVPGVRGHGTHGLILLLRLRADDLLHVVGREPQLLLAPVVPPPPARGERIKASGPIWGRTGVFMLHAMSGSGRRRGRGTEKEAVKTHRGTTRGKTQGVPSTSHPQRCPPGGYPAALTSRRPACRRCG